MPGLGKLAAAGVVAAALAGCAVNVPGDAFFWPDTRLEAENMRLRPNPPPPEGEILRLTYGDDPIGATRMRTSAAGRPLILFCGGNMFRRESGGGSAARKLAPFGDVLMFDYPGYGDTGGMADFASFRAVGEVVAATARAQAEAEGRPLIAWGHSLGGVVCAEAAKTVGADALVLETTTPDARAAINNQLGMMRPFIRTRIDPGLASVDVPASLDGFDGRVVVLEAGPDATLPPALSQELTRRLQQRGLNVVRLVFPEAEHNTVGAQPDFEPRVSAALGL